MAFQVLSSFSVKSRSIQINFLILLCPFEFFHGIQPKFSAITRKVQISDRSNLIDKIDPRCNLQ